MRENELPIIQQSLFPARFGASFLDDHAGTIITDPRIALVELVANAWDAGADRVDISWAENDSSEIEIRDNGTGMTSEEFQSRWLELNYSRASELGPNVQFPPGNQRSQRKAFAKNGKGRHGMFCFSRSYHIETTKAGTKNHYVVERSSGTSNQPFIVRHLESNSTTRQEHGTSIWTENAFPSLPVQGVIELLGSRFIADPSFHIFVNGIEVELSQLANNLEEDFIQIEGVGIIKVSLVDTESRSRTSQQHGVAWWVNRRLVGNVEWRKLSGETYADGRTTEARRYTFVVEADPLQDAIKEDWSGFDRSHDIVDNVAGPVEDHISKKLYQLLEDVRKRRKQNVIERNKTNIVSLPKLARWQIGQFIDKIQEKSPTIREEHLSDAVEVLAKLEQAKTGYHLLRQLASLETHELDMLHELLQQWTVNDAKMVLDELDKRIKLIQELERLVDNSSSDELHDLQPLFERGLWMFGPEYESIEFTSNQTLATVVRDFFGDRVTQVESSRRRPDFVFIPDSSIGLYSCDSYDDDGEVNGIRKLVILELKRGGFMLTRKEIRQTDDYIAALQQSGKVTDSTRIFAFVLGSRLDEYTRSRTIQKSGVIQIHAIPYSTLLRRAHARVFKLTEKLQAKNVSDYSDPDVESILDQPDQLQFDEVNESPTLTTNSSR